MDLSGGKHLVVRTRVIILMQVKSWPLHKQTVKYIPCVTYISYLYQISLCSATSFCGLLGHLFSVSLQHFLELLAFFKVCLSLQSLVGRSGQVLSSVQCILQRILQLGESVWHFWNCSIISAHMGHLYKVRGGCIWCLPKFQTKSHTSCWSGEGKEFSHNWGSSSNLTVPVVVGWSNFLY